MNTIDARTAVSSRRALQEELHHEVEPGKCDIVGLYEQHARTIHRYLARRLGTDLADDLTADTFVIAISRWGSYEPEQGPALAWLYGIATNLVRTHRRREKAELLATRRLQARPPDQLDVADAVIGRVDDSRTADLLGPAVAALKSGDRDVLLLVAWTELSYDEVAQALNIPIGTVRSRLHRARRQVKTSRPVNKIDEGEHS